MYSERMADLKSSAIRDILKIISRKGMISFAGGLPAPELFPLKEIEEATHRALVRYGSNALQYSITEGIIPLREKIAAMLDPRGQRVRPHNVIITQGSQQALELLSKLFLDKGSLVLTENPSYLGALQAFRIFQARVRAVASDERGIRTESLRHELARERPAFIYLMTNFQNPTGISLDVDRRREIAAIARDHDVIVIEDDPYGELRFEGEAVPSLFSFGTGRNIVYLSTFSKTIAPGLRVAYAAGDEELIGKLTLLKQGTDLQTNTFGQFIINEYLELGKHRDHISLICRTYGERRNLMLGAMKRHFPGSFTWNRPRGGMFLWVAMPEGWDAKKILLRCIEDNVAFVPGQEFFPDGGRRNTMRMNFSNASPETIEEGIKRMGEVFKELSVSC